MIDLGYLIAVVLSYLLGAVPFGLLFAKVLAGTDPREHGSGNIGATNAMRSGGKKVGILTLLADIAKASLPVAIAIQADFSEIWIATIGFAAFFGHCFPIWLKFKGGKGVATMFGVMLPWMPWVAVAAFAIWLLLFKSSGYVSLASVLAGLSLPLWTWGLGGSVAAIITASLLGLIVMLRHHSNIQRLLDGTEAKVSKNT